MDTTSQFDGELTNEELDALFSLQNLDIGKPLRRLLQLIVLSHADEELIDVDDVGEANVMNEALKARESLKWLAHQYVRYV